MLVDYHMHTPLCHHAEGLPTDYAAHAKSVGLREIGFTDHSPMERDDFDDWRMAFNDLPAYIDMVEQARRDHPDLSILISLELDYLPEQEDWVRRLIDFHPWDYLLGSVHYIDFNGPWDIDNPKKMYGWRDQSAWQVWSAYFERLTQAAASGLFTTIGHADLPKKFGIYPDEDCSPLYDRFLDAAAQSGTAIELNTAGLHKECKEIYPCPALLRMAKDKGVRITFGSDAHAPAEVGRDFQPALQFAKDCGHTHYLKFKNHQPIEIPLP